MCGARNGNVSNIWCSRARAPPNKNTNDLEYVDVCVLWATSKGAEDGGSSAISFAIDKIVGNIVFMTFFSDSPSFVGEHNYTTCWLSPFPSRSFPFQHVALRHRKIHSKTRVLLLSLKLFRVCAPGAMPQCFYFQKLFRTIQSTECEHL